MPRATTFKFIDESSRECGKCGAVLARPSDMRRHMRTHGLEMTEVKYQCTWDGCSFQALQKSNLKTHYRTHTQDKSQACPSCDFKTCDPGSLTRHRKRIHGYVPKPRKARGASSDLSIPPSLTWVSSELESGLDRSSPSSSMSSSSSPESIMDFSLLTSALDVKPSITPEIDEFCKPFFLDGFPSDLDGLFYGPDSMSGFGCSTFEDLRPRPLFPAVESTPALESFRPLHSSSSPNLSLLSEVRKTSPLTTTPYVDDQIFHSISCGVFQDGFGDSIQQPLPTPYDSIIQQMEEMDPSISVSISESDFRVIYGCDYEQFVAAKARHPLPLSEPSCSSESTSPTAFTARSPSPRPYYAGSLLAELYAPIDS
ncbi:hypothetical protein GGU10DRAFT_74708 [Lentinula aff. detonsa]|uniref:C2H2-type domain-containing protein n=1 Tax=Lentinula aff. detonsa TaxID=2804958 RepID=A0AA38KM61_9AGAR|nr:hypothetical protein GGU10DRAFT_74708 [Lentinula aff. detonsa]